MPRKRKPTTPDSTVEYDQAYVDNVVAGGTRSALVLDAAARIVAQRSSDGRRFESDVIDKVDDKARPYRRVAIRDVGDDYLNALAIYTCDDGTLLVAASEAVYFEHHPERGVRILVLPDLPGGRRS